MLQNLVIMVVIMTQNQSHTFYEQTGRMADGLFSDQRLNCTITFVGSILHRQHSILSLILAARVRLLLQLLPIFHYERQENVIS